MVAGTIGGEDLQAGAVRVLEEEAARICPLGVRHDPLVRERGPKLAQRPLGRANLLDVLNLERQMVQPRATAVVRPLGLLPRVSTRVPSFARKASDAPGRAGLAQDVEPEERAGKTPWS